MKKSGVLQSLCRHLRSSNLLPPHIEVIDGSAFNVDPEGDHGIDIDLLHEIELGASRADQHYGGHVGGTCGL